MTHYHVFAGLHGYLPNFAETADNYPEAVDVLAELHELGRDRKRQLRREGHLELNLHRDGNEYAEIEGPCNDECTAGDFLTNDQ